MDTRPRTQTGFTLLELLMTIAVAAIVTMIAVPSFRYVTNSNRIAGEVNGLLGDLQFARSEAIKEGRNVTVCVSTSGAGCTGGTAWKNGWIVFSDQGTVGTFDGGGVDTLLRVQPTFSGTDSFAASNTVSVITFNREGYATGIAAGTLITLHDSTNTTAWTRCLSITFNGMMSSLKYDGVTCN
ncbi:MAG TPA: GspH/FimT family pseudopilin [Steroidobacteraceae bacterium]